MRTLVSRAAVAILASAAPAAAHPTTERLEQVIWLKPRGEVEVEERHIVRFDTAGVNTVLRNLRTPYPLIAVVVSAAVDDRVVSFDDEVGDEQSGVQLHAVRGLRQVRWKVSPRPGSVHSFGVTYLLWNAVRQDALGDYFRWRVAPLSPPGRIENAVVRIAFSHPLGAPPEIDSGTAAVRLDPEESRLTVEARGIPHGEQLDLTLRFAANTAVGSGLRWQRLREARRRRAIVVFPIATGALLGALALHAFRRRARSS